MKPTTLDIMQAIPWGFKYHGTFTSLKLKLEPDRAKVLIKRYPSVLSYKTRIGKVILAWQEPGSKTDYWNEILSTIKATKMVRKVKQLELFS